MNRRLPSIIAVTALAGVLTPGISHAGLVTGLSFDAGLSVNVMAPTTLTVVPTNGPHIIVSPTTPDPAPVGPHIPMGQNVSTVRVETDSDPTLEISDFSWEIAFAGTHSIDTVTFGVGPDPMPMAPAVGTFIPPIAFGMGAMPPPPAGWMAPIVTSNLLTFKTIDPSGIVGGTHIFVFPVDIGRPGPAMGGTPGSFLLNSQVSNPEPGTMVLSGIGMLAGAVVTRRRRRQKEKAATETAAV